MSAAGPLQPAARPPEGRLGSFNVSARPLRIEEVDARAASGLGEVTP
jgi:hypothetical protein